jgi:hypothetical protein
MEIIIEQPAELPKDFYVYLHRKATTGEVFYVGKGFGRRAWKVSCKRSQHWKNTVRKHGLIVEIAADGLQEWYAHEMERDLIALYGRRDLGHGPLVNLTDGGEGLVGYSPTVETLAKKSAAMQDLLKNPEYRAKHSAAMSLLWGSKDWKEKQSSLLKSIKERPGFEDKRIQSLRSLSFDQGFIDRTSEVNRARASNPLWIDKMREVGARLSSDPVWRARNAKAMKILHANKEWQANRAASIRDKLGRPVICLDTGLLYNSLASAIEFLNKAGHHKAASGKISQAASGKRKTAYGYTWRYADQQKQTASE